MTTETKRERRKRKLKKRPSARELLSTTKKWSAQMQKISAMAEAVTEALVGQAEIGGKTEIRAAVAETTGKKETITEAVRAGQVRLGAVAVPEAQHKGGAVTMRPGGLIFIVITIAEAKRLIVASTPLVFRSERLKISAQN